MISHYQFSESKTTLLERNIVSLLIKVIMPSKELL